MLSLCIFNAKKKVYMNKIFSFCIFGFIIIIASSCKDEKSTEDKKTSSRTVLMYLIADNDISYDIYGNIASVEAGLRNTKTPGTFVIYWDGGRYYQNIFSTPTLFKYVIDEKGKLSEREIIQRYSEQNSCSQEVIINIINDVKQLCPSESYGLIFGSHATGWLPANTSRLRSLGDDNGAKIEIPELNEALLASNVHFDFILMDACLMSQVEVAYELRYATDYLIMSPAEVMAAGFPYTDITKYLMATNDKEQNLINAAKQYVDSYRSDSYPWATIAVLKTSELNALAAAMRSVFEQYHTNFDIFTYSYLTTLNRNVGYGRSVLGYSSYDISAFVDCISKGNSPQLWEEQLSRVIIYKDYVDDYSIVNIDPDFYSGLGTYIPYTTFTKWNSYYQTLQWYDDAGWKQSWIW